MHKPNLFLIGAMKSGSTTLHELLAAHPQIAMSEPKEPSYFVDPDVLKEWWPEMWRMGHWKEESAYLALFPDKPGARWYGESSTDYSKRPRIDGVVEKLAAYAPEARFIYIMRDPVQRTISHYWHMVEHRGETRAPLQAIKEDPHYTEVSYYAMQLRPYLQTFGSQRVATLTFEALLDDPVKSVQTLYHWLEVDEHFSPQDPDSARNATPATVRQQRNPSGLLDRFRHSALWDRVGGWVPSPVRKMGVTLVEHKVERKQVDMSEVRNHLIALQKPQTEELSGLLGRSFPEWTSLNAVT